MTTITTTSDAREIDDFRVELILNIHIQYKVVKNGSWGEQESSLEISVLPASMHHFRMLACRPATNK